MPRANTPHAPEDGDHYLETLQQLIGITASELRPTRDQAATMVAGALSADKVDVFQFEAKRNTLVARG